MANIKIKFGIFQVHERSLSGSSGNPLAEAAEASGGIPLCLTARGLALVATGAPSLTAPGKN